MADFGFPGALVDDIFDLDPLVLEDLPFNAYYPIPSPVPPTPKPAAVGTPWGGAATPDSGAFPYWWEFGRIRRPEHAGPEVQDRVVDTRRPKLRPPRRLVVANIPTVLPSRKRDPGFSYPPERQFRPVTPDALADYRRRVEGRASVQAAVRRSVAAYRAWSAERLREANARALALLMLED